MSGELISSGLLLSGDFIFMVCSELKKVAFPSFNSVSKKVAWLMIFCCELSIDAEKFLSQILIDLKNVFPQVFHLCAKTEAGYMMKSFRCPKETVFDQEVM